MTNFIFLYSKFFAGLAMILHLAWRTPKPLLTSFLCPSCGFASIFSFFFVEKWQYAEIKAFADIFHPKASKACLNSVHWLCARMGVIILRPFYSSVLILQVRLCRCTIQACQKLIPYPQFTVNYDLELHHRAPFLTQIFSVTRHGTIVPRAYTAINTADNYSKSLFLGFFEHLLQINGRHVTQIRWSECFDDCAAKLLKFFMQNSFRHRQSYVNRILADTIGEILERCSRFFVRGMAFPTSAVSPLNEVAVNSKKLLHYHVVHCPRQPEALYKMYQIVNGITC